MNLLDGVRVIECAILPTGDHVGRLLGDLGADVIKVEAPGVGDYVRRLGGTIGAPNHSPLHMVVNRNKRSVVLDLRKASGIEIFYRLLSSTDIFVDGFAGDACDRLGIGYEQQRRAKPDIIYCQASGFGVKGPYGRIPSHGYSMSAVGGAVALELCDDGTVSEVPERPTEYGGPFFPGQLDAPLMGAIWAVSTTLASLHHRDATGEGVYIDCSATDAVIASQVADNTAEWNISRTEFMDGPPRPVRGEPRVQPKYSYYATADGKFAMLGAIEEKFWRNFCLAVGREDLLRNNEGDLSDRSGVSDLLSELQGIFESRTLSEWMELADRHDVPIAPVNSRQDLLRDPHLRARAIVEESVHPVAGAFTTVGWPAVVSGQSFETARPAPELGEHTDEVLLACGFSAEDVGLLREAGVV